MKKSVANRKGLPRRSIRSKEDFCRSRRRLCLGDDNDVGETDDDDRRTQFPPSSFVLVAGDRELLSLLLGDDQEEEDGDNDEFLMFCLWNL